MNEHAEEDHKVQYGNFASNDRIGASHSAPVLTRRVQDRKKSGRQSTGNESNSKYHLSPPNGDNGFKRVEHQEKPVQRYGGQATGRPGNEEHPEEREAFTDDHCGRYVHVKSAVTGMKDNMCNHVDECHELVSDCHCGDEEVTRAPHALVEVPVHHRYDQGIANQWEQDHDAVGDETPGGHPRFWSIKVSHAAFRVIGRVIHHHACVGDVDVSLVANVVASSLFGLLCSVMLCLMRCGSYPTDRVFN